MRKQLVLAALAIAFFTLHAFSQGKVRGSVRGTVADTAGKQSMEDATVSLTPSEDTTDVQFVITDKHGAFSFHNLNPGKYRLLITFEGYMHVARTFTVGNTNKDIDYGTLYMQRITDKLPDLVIQSPPMTIKKDTVEYNADMFAVKPNAVAEDQLKKLPGVQVDASGNITAQGEKVQRVMVNGKRFFGDDPKLATRNLPPDMIEKYQVFDDLDDQSKFTGIDDGNRIKTINIVTKKDRRRGYFGRAIAGVGTDETYNESINFHRFNNDQQISILGEGNDINKQNFTVQDILGSSGSRRGSGGGPSAATNQSGSGITTVWAGGINYRDSWTPKIDATGSYFYNFNHVSTAGQSLTQRFFDPTDDTSNITNSSSSAISRTTNQRANFNLEDHIDSADDLVFRPNVAFQTTNPNSNSTSSTVDQNGNPVNSSVTSAHGTTSGFNINGSNLTIRHKFGKPRRTLTLDMTGTVNDNQGTGYYTANNHFYALDSIQNLNQFYNDTLRSVTLSPTLLYTEPVTRTSVIELDYNHTYTQNKATNNTYDYDSAAKGYASFDSLFSNSYKFLSNSDRLSLNYRISKPRYVLSLGGGMQYLRFNSLNTTKDIDVAHNYVNLTPTINFSYSFSSYQRLRFYYTGRTGTPSASQLQPLTTTSNDISYTVGNPNLKPQFTHSIRALYSSFNPSSQNVLFATVNASTTVNDIQSEVVPNEKGGQTSTYVNLNGTYNVAGYFDYGFSLKRPKSNLNFITNVNYGQSQTLVDSSAKGGTFQHDWSRTTGLSEGLTWTTNIKKNFDMNLSATSTYNILRNSLKPTADFDYFTESVDAEVTAYTNSGWLIATTFTYNYTNNHTPGYNASIPLISPSIAKELFKKKNGEIRLSMFDLLHENTAVSKSVSLNQVSESRTSTLTQYVMLTFTYNLNNFPGGRQRNGRMPGVFPRGGGGGRGGGGFGGGGGGGRRGG